MNTNYLINEIQEMKKNHPSVLISLVGAGGKTTTVFQLANQLKNGASVLLTTTTAMFHPHDQVDDVYYGTLPKLPYYKNKITALFYDYEKNKDKVSGIDSQLANQITQEGIFDYIINEADGAKRKPLKCYGPHEPVIPKESHIVIVVLGADAIGKVLSEDTVHRTEAFTEVTKLNVGDIITSDSLIKLLTHRNGFLKDLPEHASTYVLINKSLSHPIHFDKKSFSDKIFKACNQYKAIIFSEMKHFKLDSIFEYKHRNSDERK
jgi:probable selenium-dependent hydroxylase accessory protein YqeC